MAAGRGGWRAGAPAGGTSSPAVRGLLLLFAAPGQDGQEEVTLRAKTTTQAAATFPSQDRCPLVSEHTGVCTFQGQRPFASVAPAPVSGEPPPRKVRQLPAKPLPEAALDERARPLPLVLARGPGSPTAAVFGKQLPVWFSICNLVSASKGLQNSRGPNLCRSLPLTRDKAHGVPAASSLAERRDSVSSGDKGTRAELATPSAQRGVLIGHGALFCSRQARAWLGACHGARAGDGDLPLPRGHSPGPQHSESILKITFPPPPGVAVETKPVPVRSCPQSQGTGGPTQEARGNRKQSRDSTLETQASPLGFRGLPGVQSCLFSSGTQPGPSFPALWLPSVQLHGGRGSQPTPGHRHRQTNDNEKNVDYVMPACSPSTPSHPESDTRGASSIRGVGRSSF